jgi:uncharacterized membrane protein YbhN (UPF0104 family)
VDEGVRKAGRPILRWVLGIGLFGGVVALVHFSVGWSSLLSPWREVPPGALATAVLLVLASYCIRTVRIHLYFSPATAGGFLRTFRLIILHNLFNNLLPMRSGEASFPLLMKREFQVPFGRSVPGLFYLRLLDLHFLILLGALVFTPGRGLWVWILPVLLLPLPLLGFQVQTWLQERVRSGHSGRLRGVTWLEGLPRSPGVVLTAWTWTAVNWSVKLLVFAWVLQVFVPVPFTWALLGSVTGELSSVLPIHGLAGAGTYEAGVMASLVPLGVDLQPALAGAVNLHLFILGTSFVSGILALMLQVGRGREEIEVSSGQKDAPSGDGDVSGPGDREGTGESDRDS